MSSARPFAERAVDRWFAALFAATLIGMAASYVVLLPVFAAG